MSHPKGLGRVCWRFISHYCTHTHFFPIFWLQINYLHSKIPPDSFVTEFKCDSSGKEKYFSTTVAKQFFFTQHGCFSQIPLGLSIYLPPSVPSSTYFRGPLNISFVLTYCSGTACCYSYSISSFFAALLNSLILTQVATFAKCLGIHLLNTVDMQDHYHHQ